MIHIRKSEDRGHSDLGWLQSKYTFSFADYHDAAHMHFGPLRVINEDYIASGQGFGEHGHRDMEIISYVVEGALQHKDSMGNVAIIKPGEVQRMSAGTGVQHSEMNPLKDSVTHLLQIWIIPEEKGITPSYGQKNFEDNFGCSELILVASQRGRNGSVTLNQDVDMYVAKAQSEGEKHHKTDPHRHLWVQVIKGNVQVDDTQLNPGDGAGIKKVDAITLKWRKGSEFILFDMP